MDYIGQMVYGNELLEGIIPKIIVDEGRLIECCSPEGHPPIEDVRGRLKETISSSVGSSTPPLKDYLLHNYKGGHCTVMVDDHTRENVHTKILLPLLFDELVDLGVKEEDLRILVCSGTHRPPTDSEYRKILGEEIWPRHRDKVHAHSCNENLVSVGNLDGVPVEIDRVAFESEVIIPLSDLDYHYFAGVAGGPKQICPGICGEKIITDEHLRMFGELGFADNVESGVVKDNPVFNRKIEVVNLILEKLAEKGTLVYSILSVVSPEGRIVHMSGGDIFETHEQDRKILDRVYILPIERRADVTVVSAMSKGIDVYQAGKAINAAYRATKNGGRILLLAPCPDGIGNDIFRDLMRISADIFEQMGTDLVGSQNQEETICDGIEMARKEVQEEVMKDFRIGKQKPVDLLRVLEHLGWGHLHIVQDGLSQEEKDLLPFDYVGGDGDPPLKRVRDFIDGLEVEGKPTYLLIEDPGFLLQPPPESGRN
jgi:nickel-dependent lactate racemase